MPLTHENDERVLDYDIGLTNLVDRTTPGMDDLTWDEMRAAAAKHGREVRFSLSLRPILAPTEDAAWARAEQIKQTIVELRAKAGLGWDDYTHSQYGQLLLEYYASGFSDRRALSFVNLYMYGGGFDMAAALLHKVIPLELFETRRLLGAVVGLIGLTVTWRLGCKRTVRTRSMYFATTSYTGGPSVASLTEAQPLTTP